MAGNILTKNEMIIMNVFWEVKKPLTSAELTDLVADKNWFLPMLLLRCVPLRRKDL